MQADVEANVVRPWDLQLVVCFFPDAQRDEQVVRTYKPDTFSPEASGEEGAEALVP